MISCTKVVNISATDIIASVISNKLLCFSTIHVYVASFSNIE